MKTTTRLLFLPVLTLLAFAAGARGQTTSTAYSNLTTDTRNSLLLRGATDGGSTNIIGDDLTYGSGSGGQNLSAFKVFLSNNNNNGSTESVTPTVVFWDSDGSAGGPGTLLGTYTLPLVTVAERTGQTLTFAVPAAKQFALPAAIGASPTHTIWAGIYVTGTSGESAVVLDAFGSELFNPPTVGSSQDQYFSSNATGSAAAVSNPAGGVFAQPFGAGAVANFGWELTTVTPGTLDVLQNFPASALTFAGPEGALLLAADGNYYGTTVAEGAAGDGTIFQLTPAGTINTIFEFSGANGSEPRGALIQGNDGLLYGTTSTGGVNGNGTIFSIPTGSTTQALKVLHSFAPGGPGDPNADGTFPSNALIQARDGNFYGVAGGGGAAGDGTVFRITPAGAFTLLASFGSDATAPSNPAGALIEDADGNLVGTSQLGGANGHGAIFQLTLAGTLTTLDSLAAANQRPFGQLVLGADGNFYGVSLFGDADGDGTVFLVTPGINGALTTLASFGIDIPQTGAASHLLMASDGNFYGVADDPGLSIYGVTPGVGGTLDFEQILDGSVGSTPTPLIQGSDGNLYGATGGGGTGSNGTIYRLNTALPPVVQFSQSEYAVNEFAGTATIRVDRLGGTDAISVNYVTEGGVPSPYPEDVDAVDGTDYQATAGTLHWAAGDQTPKFFTVQIIDTGVTAGGLHTLSMQLNSPQGSAGLGFQNTATLTINDSVQYAPKITSAKTASAKQGVPFSYQITATNHPASYTVSGLTDGFSLNTTTGVISGTPSDAGELDLTLHAANAIGSASAPLTVTIAANSPLHFGAASYSVNEDAGSITIHVLRDGGSAGAVSVVCATSGSTAKSGTDYTGLSQTLSWANGDTSQKAFKVSIKDLGLTDGSTRSFSARLSAPTGAATLGTPASATITIKENDPAGTLAFAASTASVNESAGTLSASVNRTAGSVGAVSVVCATASGTAKTGTDYTGLSQTLSWAAGDTAPKTFRVSIKDLGLTDGSTRQFSLKLSNAGGGVTLGSPATATVTIHENDPAQGELAFSASAYSVKETAGTLTVQVARKAGSTGAVSVVCGTSSGTAKSQTDYTGKSQTLSWAAGDTAAKTFTVAITNRGASGGKGLQFSVKLSSPTGSAILGSPATATVTIQ